MAMVIQIETATGAIAGVFVSNTDALVEAQCVVDDPTYTYVLLPEDVAPGILQEQHAWLNDTLTAKTVLTITASPNPFDADGVQECRVTVNPFVACTLVVNGTPYALTEEDQALILTAEVPATFVATLDPMVTHRADALTIEAA